MLSFIELICVDNWDPSKVIIEAATTDLDTPQALPSAFLDGTNTYGTFLSSHNNGRWRRISSGSVSAAKMINSACPLFSVLVASFAPFFSCLWWNACWTNSSKEFVICPSARGKAFPLSFWSFCSGCN